jgi:phage terminase large subunit
VDWGFSNDPFAFVRVAIENNTLYVCEEIYQRGLLNRDSAALVKPIVRNELVYCDSAEPKSVQEYVSYEIKAHSVLKGPGSLESGIKHMQSYDRIVIHPKCKNLLTEFKSYQWKEDKNGDQVAQPIDAFNHGIDAIRYALEKDMNYKRVNRAKVIPMTQPVGWMG